MIRKTDEAGPLREAVIGWLTAHAETVGHPFNKVDVLFEARDAGVLVGGLVGRITEGWLYIELVALAPELRGMGTGRGLLEAAEAEARARGCIGIWLDTYTFQAPDFYRGLGFVEFGRIEDYPPGHARVFFQKRLP